MLPGMVIVYIDTGRGSRESLRAREAADPAATFSSIQSNNSNGVSGSGQHMALAA